jgi:hypothetical protein
LNPVSDVASSTLATGIPQSPPKKGRNPIQITLGKAIALENNRGSVAAAQKAGRKGKKRRYAQIEANEADEADEADDDAGEGPATISSPSAGPSARASKRVRRPTYKAIC